MTKLTRLFIVIVTGSIKAMLERREEHEIFLRYFNEWKILNE